MKKISTFKSLSRKDLTAIKGGGNIMKLRSSCGPNCKNSNKCSNMEGCFCDGEFCGFL
ncbi:hypothetical protein KTO58_14430 [Chitinophaga pendula]|uniref:hypothetical protein n=1 Tax=Chitinophaga TaxID=79328 RepID=UPI0012FDE9A6|nr:MULTISPECIES: hypothetical protein [Chitinophaga]UCJ04899.1 hypothetical protein KTO58_14430 [Chitinophaga pendula]